MPSNVGNKIKKLFMSAFKEVGAIGKDITKTKGAQVGKALTKEETEKVLQKIAIPEVKKQLGKGFKENVAKIVDEKIVKDRQRVINLATETYKKDNKTLTKGVVERLKAVGLDEDEIRKFDTKELSFANLSETLKNKHRAKYYKEFEGKLYVEVKDRFGDAFKKIDDQLSKVKDDGVAGTIKRAKILYDARTGWQASVVGRQPKENVFQKISNIRTTLKDKVDILYKDLKGKGLVNESEKAIQFRSFVDSLEGFQVRSKNMISGLKAEWAKYTDDQQWAITQYIENLDKTRMKLRNSNTSGNLAMMQLEADDVIAKQFQLTDDMIMSANKTMDVFRRLKKTEWKMANRDFNYNDLVDFENIKGFNVPDKNLYSTPKVGDLGINYMHIAPNAERRKELLELSFEKNIFENMSTDLQNLTGGSSMWKSRNIDGSLLRNDRSARLKASEAFDDYIGKYTNSLTKTYGNSYLDEMSTSFTVFSPFNASAKEVGQNIDAVGNLKKHWDDIHARRDNIPESNLFKVMTVFTDLTKKTALASPRTALFNLSQPFTNNVTKDFTSIMKAQLKNTSTFFDIVFTGGNKKNAVQRMINRRHDPATKKVFERYFREFYPDLYAANMNFGHSQFGDKINKLTNWITFAYTNSDMITRAVNLDASILHANKVFKKWGHLKQSNTKEYVKQLRKGLNLDAFGSVDDEVLTNLMMKSNSDDFLYEYARRATDLEIYNYGKYGRPEIIDKAKKNPVTSNMLAFMSWPLYYTEVLGGAISAAKNGNYKPLASLSAIAGGWYLGMSQLAEVDNETLANIGSYGIYRTPVIQPVASLPLALERSFGGVLFPSVAAIMYPGFKTISELDNTITTKPNFFDFTSNNLEKAIVNSPVVSRSKDLYETLNWAIQLGRE